ncbi:hypothetical protein DL93DRAFT_1095069 [Clavulina sp. PMI_390]|nr:hypothetical protein DL93DRAFT_1095069 [Clavulina sp. PMI_390]
MQDPISVLSSELVLIIIKHLLASAKDTPPANIACLTTVTAISSCWRNLAIEYGPLWANIYVKLSKPPTPWPQNHPKLPTRLHANDIDRVRSFLHRSKQSPISLFIPRSWVYVEKIPEGKRLAVEQEWRLMDDLLAPHMDRCCSISVIFRGGRTGQAKLPMLLQPWKFTLLRELVVDSRYLTASEDFSLWNEAWELSPQLTPLRTLKFSDSQRYLPKALDAPWPLLNTIDLAVAAHFWPRVRDTLAELPSLKELHISLESDAVRGVTPLIPLGTRITLPFVQCVATNYPPIWIDISTPSVHHVIFTPGTSYDALQDRVFPDLPQLLTDLPVHKVTLSGASINRGALSVLGPFKHVESLHFCQSTLQGRVLSHLADLLQQSATDKTQRNRIEINSDITQEAGSFDSLLPSLKKISIEEPKDRYWIFWDVPHLVPQPPYLFSYLSTTERTTEEVREKRALCDRCRTLRVGGKLL